MQIYSSDSAYQAKALLGALQTGNTERLRTELDRIDCTSRDVYDSGETERLELLSAIATSLQSLAQPCHPEASDVYRNLLQHLASPGTERKQRRSTAPVLGYARAAAATLLQ